MTTHSDRNLSFAESLTRELDNRKVLVRPNHPFTRRDDIKMQETDPSGISANIPGAKLDAGKQRPHLMFSGFANALERIAEVTTKGAIKYTPNGWMQVENGVERYADAAGRHQLALWQGDKIDEDTGCDHEAQVIWNLLASYELKLRKELTSDIFQPFKS